MNIAIMGGTDTDKCEGEVLDRCNRLFSCVL